MFADDYYLNLASVASHLGARERRAGDEIHKYQKKNKTGRDRKFIWSPHSYELASIMLLFPYVRNSSFTGLAITQQPYANPARVWLLII